MPSLSHAHSNSGFIPQITLTTILYFLLLSPPPSLSLNITALLSTFPDLSQFTALLSSATPLAADLSDRTSLSLLAVPNSFLSSDDHIARHHLSPSALADVLRYHVLLQFLSWSDLRSLPPSGKLVTTLFQTTGRATENFGSVNITHDPQSGVVSIRSPAPYSPSNATVLGLVKTLLIPYGFDQWPTVAPFIPSSFVFILFCCIGLYKMTSCTRFLLLIIIFLWGFVLISPPPVHGSNCIIRFHYSFSSLPSQSPFSFPPPVPAGDSFLPRDAENE